MAENPHSRAEISSPEGSPSHTDNAGANESPRNDEKEPSTEQIETALHVKSDSSSENLHKTAAIATIQQQHTIPSTGKRMPTSKWEYIFFCVFCKSRQILE